MTSVPISDAAVEAVARTVYGAFPAKYFDDSVATWEQLDDSMSGQRRKALELAKARVALEAAWNSK